MTVNKGIQAFAIGWNRKVAWSSKGEDRRLLSDRGEFIKDCLVAQRNTAAQYRPVA
ncbi:hypothetical protein ACVWZ3_007124 [Bradyrhizobium sp. i1.3.6]